MSVIPLSAFDLALAATLVIILAGLSIALRLRLTQRILVAGLRTTVQLLLVGLMLKWLFEQGTLLWVILMSVIMLAEAGYEAGRRQERNFKGWWGFGIGTSAMLVSSFTLSLIALSIIIQVDPWYTPRYAIPLLGMLLGNTMTGIALGLDRLVSSAWQQRRGIEARLMLGQPWPHAIDDIRRESMRAGLIPILNAMAVAGLVSLPGMMTGQILAGSEPLEAVKYQILIMFLIAGGTGFGTLAAVWLGARRLFDVRHRLRLDRVA